MSNRGGDIVGDGEVNDAVGVVPVECDAEVLLSFPVIGDGVHGLEELVGFFTHVFDTKPIDYDSEGYFLSGVLPAGGYKDNGEVSKLGWLILDVLVCSFISYLFEP